MKNKKFPMYQLVKVTTADNLQLSGLYQDGSVEKTAYILIHGFTADFYSHPFYHTIAAKLKIAHSALILAQNRGTGLHTEFIMPNGEGKYLGSFYEKIEEAHLDISAFIKLLLEEGYTKIGLIGHSLGTIKVVRYLFEGEYKNNISELILLAPFDKNAFMERKAPGQRNKFLSSAKDMIDSGHGRDIVPVPEYEDYPMTYENYVSWYEDNDLSNMWDFYRKGYGFPILQKIDIPVKVIIGENDEFTTYPEFDETPAKILEIMKKHLNKCQTFLVEDSNHTYFGHEDEVADLVMENSENYLSITIGPASKS